MATDERETAMRGWQERETAHRAPRFWYVKNGEVFDSFSNFQNRHLTRDEVLNRVIDPTDSASGIFDREEDARTFAVTHADAVEARRREIQRETEARLHAADAETAKFRQRSRDQVGTTSTDQRRGWTDQERFNDEPNMPWDEA